MGTIIRTSWDTSSPKNLMKDGILRKIFDTSEREAQVFYKPLVNDLKTTDEWVKDQRMAGLTSAIELQEGQNIPVQIPVLGTTKTYTQRQFGTGFRMTFRMDKFNKYNLWKRWAKDLRKVMEESKDIEIHVMFNSPTSVALTAGVGFDTLAMANDAKTGLLSGSTADNYDNYLNAALSYSSLESARYYYKTLKDDLGMLVGGNPTHLVIEPTLWPTASEIYKSGLKPHEESNTANIFKDYTQIYEDPRLTSTTMWFMLDTKSSMHDLNVFTSMAPEFRTQDAPDNTWDRQCLSMMMFTYGWGDSRTYFLGKL